MTVVYYCVEKNCFLYRVNDEEVWQQTRSKYLFHLGEETIKIKPSLCPIHRKGEVGGNDGTVEKVQ